MRAQANSAQIYDAMRAASHAKLRGILAYSTGQPVSVDFNHNPAACIFDATQTKLVDEGLTHLTGWRDNEWGFFCRMFDTAALFGTLR